jgi:hypothetical protein
MSVILLYLSVSIIPCEPPLGRVAGGVRAPAMLGKDNGRKGKKGKGACEWGVEVEVSTNEAFIISGGEV